MMKKMLLTLCLSGLLCPMIRANEPVEVCAADNGKTAQTAAAPRKVQARIGGRFLLDGTAYLGELPKSLNHQVNITDMRLTGQLSYEDWYLRIDVGFDGNKVGIKDSFLQWSRKGNVVRIGHTLGSFGIDPAITTYDYLFLAPANIHNLVFFGRHIGLIYNRVQPHWYLSVCAFMGDNINITPTTEQGFNSALRTAWRPINEKGRVVQAGLSGIFRLPNRDKATGLRTIDLGCNGVTTLNAPLFQQLTLSDARNQNIIGTEFLLTWDKWLLQAEYMAMFINRKDAPFYTAHGGYVQAGYLIKGSSFGYDSGEALPTAPADPGSLQLVARYNFSTLNDHRTKLYGGRQHDISVGLNYQFNKYICSRLDYSYVMLDEHSPFSAEFENPARAGVHQLQARLAFWF